MTEYEMDVKFEVVRPLIGMGADHLLPRISHISADDAENSQPDPDIIR